MAEEHEKRTELADLGEFGLIDRIKADTEIYNSTSMLGIGDDAAVIRHDHETTVVSTDLMIEGIHFDMMYMPLKHLGYKAVVTNLSDIYAMNAIPTQITVSIAISNRFSLEAIDTFYEGVHLACKMYNVDLIGGDTTTSNKGLIISVTAMGQAPVDQLVYRSGAGVGDIICVSGDLGAAFLGLQLLEREKQVYLANPGVQPDLEEQDYLVGRQLKPEARRDAIQSFRKYDLKPTAMIDISDGLSSDLKHICQQSNVGAYIEEAKVPMHPMTEEVALKFKFNPIMCALNGGEDYELLFTVKESELEKIRFMPEVYIIGEITDVADGIKLHTTGGNIHELVAQGWKHF